MIANDRLAYQDYLEMLEDLNKQIGSGYQRIVRANHKATAGKKKRGPGQKEGGDAAIEASKAKSLVVDVPESLVNAIELRGQFKEVTLTWVAIHSFYLILWYRCLGLRCWSGRKGFPVELWAFQKQAFTRA
jgi:hypothetical protein